MIIVTAKITKIAKLYDQAYSVKSFSKWEKKDLLTESVVQLLSITFLIATLLSLIIAKDTIITIISAI